MSYQSRPISRAPQPWQWVPWPAGSRTLPVNTDMAEVTKSSDRQDLDAVLEDSRRPDVCTTLLSTAALAKALADMQDSMDLPSTSALPKVLMSMGFTYLDRVEIDGRKSRYWSQEPERFMRDGECDPQLIREYLEWRGL